MNTSPIWSDRLYLYVNRKDIAYLRFILESHHNIAYISVLDKYEAVAQLTFTPAQKQEVLSFLNGLSREINIQVLDLKEN